MKEKIIQAIRDYPDQAYKFGLYVVDLDRGGFAIGYMPKGIPISGPMHNGMREQYSKNGTRIFGIAYVTWHATEKKDEIKWIKKTIHGQMAKFWKDFNKQPEQPNVSPWRRLFKWYRKNA